MTNADDNRSAYGAGEVPLHALIIEGMLRAGEHPQHFPPPAASGGWSGVGGGGGGGQGEGSNEGDGSQEGSQEGEGSQERGEDDEGAAAAASAAPERACAACGATTGLKLCQDCRGVRHCSVACQRQHWREHRAECRRVAAGQQQA